MRTAHLLAAVLLAFPTLARAEAITLANGDELHGEIVRRSGAIVYFMHPQLGELELEESALMTFDTPRRSQPTGHAGSGRSRPAAPEERSESESEDAKTEGEEKEQEQDKWWDPKKGGLFGTPLLRGWENSFGLGLTGSQGGFDDTKLNILFTSKKENSKRRWLIDSYYFLNVTPQENTDDSTTTKNQGMALVRREWLRTDDMKWSRLFAFAQSRYRFDLFQSWKNRIGAHVGPGYELLRGSSLPWRLKKLGTFDLDVGAGLGGSYTFGSTDDAAVEGLLGFYLEWRINTWSAIRSTNEWIINLQDGNTFRTNQQLDWDFDIGELGGLGIRLGSRFRHDTESQGRENDLSYLASVTYDF